jgi:hypothetical protein
MVLIQLPGYVDYCIHRRFSSSSATVDTIIQSLALQMKVTTDKPPRQTDVIEQP